MRIYIKWSKVALLLVITTQVFSQTYSVTGTVTDKKDNAPLAFANLVLKNNADTTQWKGAVTDIDGNFKFENVFSGNYKISIAYVGYKFNQTTIRVGNTHVNGVYIKMETDIIKLKNVEIASTQTRAEQKGDTTEFNANAYKVNPDASAGDLIEKMSGVTNENGTVKVGGEDVQRVLIDGQEFFGDDAAIALKNIPAEIIDKIQVYDKLSDQAEFSGFDDGSREKTINIKTKPGKNKGQFGKIYAGYGTDERYTAGGNINFFNDKQRVSLVALSNNINQQNFSSQDLLGVSQATSQQRGRGRNSSGANNFLVGQQGGINTTNSIGINYSDVRDKWKINGSYFINNTNNETQSTIDRQYFLTDSTSQHYNEINSSGSRNVNHRLNLRLEYTIDSSNSILLTPRLNFQQNNSNRILNSSSVSSENTLLNTTSNFNTSNQFSYNFSNSALYRHKFNKQGRTLSVDLKTDVSDREGLSTLNSSSFFYESADSMRALDQQTTTQSEGYTLSTNLVYTEPLSKTSQLSLNYTPSYSRNMSDRLTSNLNSLGNDYTLLDSSLSNSFDNTVLAHRTGLGLRSRSAKYRIMAGIDYQNVNLSSEQLFPKRLQTLKVFNNVLPKVIFRYMFSKTTNLRLHYITSTQTPSINQLQNVVNNSNPLLLSTGNPDLKQQYTHAVTFRFSTVDSTSTKPFFGMLSVNYTNDYIGNSTLIAEKDTVVTDRNIPLNQGSQITLPVNLDGYLSARMFFTYGFPVSKLKSNLNLNTGFTYNCIPGLINNDLNLSNTFNINSGLILGSNISEKIDFKISYSSNYTIVKNSIQPQRDNNYYTGVLSGNISLMPWKKWVISSDINQNHFLGLGAGYNQSIWLWNGGIGYKFLKSDAAEIRISVFDILKQNNSISRSVTETYVEDTETAILQRFFLLTFTYNLRNFKS